VRVEDQRARASVATGDLEKMGLGDGISAGTSGESPISRRLSCATQSSALSPQSLKNHFADEVAAGLSGAPKRLPCKYLYDDTGSRLFQEIMELDEYYPTRCEAAILEQHKEEIAALVGRRAFNLVELGAGDGKKTRILLRHFLDRGSHFRYVPIDICPSAIRGLMDDLATEFQGLQVQGLATEYFEGLKWLGRFSRQANVVLFLGSNIGNFSPSETTAFLSGLWNAMNNSDFLLIGFDLKKDAQTLVRAYNDSKGVTARFNINMLHRINNELGGDFDPGRFQYYSTYNPHAGAVESFLVSLKDQTVHIDQCRRSFPFSQWEPIQTESSYKFLKEDLSRLARENGFRQVASLCDSQGYFADSLWQVRKAA
jgi:L-histidine Nalpha-methyltransferase